MRRQVARGWALPCAGASRRRIRRPAPGRDRSGRCSTAPASRRRPSSSPRRRRDRMPPTPMSGIAPGRRVRSMRSTAVDLPISGAPDRPPASLARRMRLRPRCATTVVLVAITPSTPRSPSTRAAASMSSSRQVRRDLHQHRHALAVLRAEPLLRLAQRADQAAQRLFFLQLAQAGGVGRGDVDGDVVGERIHALQAVQVVVVAPIRSACPRSCRC